MTGKTIEVILPKGTIAIQEIDLSRLTFEINKLDFSGADIAYFEYERKPLPEPDDVQPQTVQEQLPELEEVAAELDSLSPSLVLMVHDVDLPRCAFPLT